MRRLFTGLVALVLTLSAGSMPALGAGSSSQKAELKDAKKDLKTFRKLHKKWNKARKKGSTQAVDAKVGAFLRDSLNELRRQGVATKRQEGKAGADTWVERYRNALVAVRDAKNVANKSSAMKRLELMLETRYERQQKRSQ